MPLSIESFRQEFADGGARPSLFEMNLFFNSGLFPELAKAPFHVRASEIPGSAVNQIIQKFAGRELKFAGARTFTSLNVTILNDENFTIRRGLEGWMNLINARVDNVRLAPNREAAYQGSALLYQFTKTGQVSQGYQFIGLFPVNLGAIPLDWNNDAVIEEYTVEFAYQYWQPVPDVRSVLSPVSV